MIYQKLMQIALHNSQFQKLEKHNSHVENKSYKSNMNAESTLLHQQYFSQWSMTIVILWWFRVLKLNVNIQAKLNVRAMDAGKFKVTTEAVFWGIHT